MRYSRAENNAIRKCFKQAADIVNSLYPPSNTTLAEYDDEWRKAFDIQMDIFGWKRTGDCLCKSEQNHEPMCGWEIRTKC